VSTVLTELFRAQAYKRTQGRITRRVTFAAMVLGALTGCYRLSQQLQFSDPMIRYGLPGLLFLLGLWLCYRIVNIPRFADFLISVEAEMAKVSWPTRSELFRSSVVVLVTILLLTAVLFAYDLVWQFLLIDLLRITGPG